MGPQTCSIIDGHSAVSAIVMLYLNANEGTTE